MRVIAATNRNLNHEVEAGRFREDLYYRLSVFPINVAPLRERLDDVPMLAEHFLEQACRRLGVPAQRLKRRHVDTLQGHEWPGNIRELQNIVERAVIGAQSGPLEFDLSGAVSDKNRSSIEAMESREASQRGSGLQTTQALRAGQPACSAGGQPIGGSQAQPEPPGYSDSGPQRWPPRSSL